MLADPQEPRFTIRVYGLLIHALHGRDHVLVSDEIIKGRQITKFPGGGLEYGEGLKECLIREIREELFVEARDLQHFYTTDFFQQSAFHATPMQVISVYYRFKILGPDELAVISSPFAYTTMDQQEGFRWLDLDNAREEDLSLPIDRVVLRQLKNTRS